MRYHLREHEHALMHGSRQRKSEKTQLLRFDVQIETRQTCSFHSIIYLPRSFVKTLGHY